VIGNTLQQVEAFKYLEVVFTSDGSRNKLIDTLICKANPVLRVLYYSVVTKRQLSKNAKLSVFNWVFVPISPVVMILRWRLKEYCQKNKRQRWDVCEGFSVWHFVTKSTGLKHVKPGCKATSPNREIPDMLVRPCPECSRKEWRTNSFWLQSTPTGKPPKVRPRTGWNDYITDLAWYRLGEEPTELPEIAIDREVFRVLLMLLPPRLSKKEKRSRKWVNEWACTPTLNLSIYEIVFSLFAKSQCRIQTIKHI